jgi:uncharacterized lipoprotein YddW (UPF0748 family)
MSRFAIALGALCLLGPATCAADAAPPLQREFRGVWIATVGNIDWPSKPALSAEKQKAELVAILDRASELKLNAVIFQVRPMADALYETKLEPWSEYLTGTMGKSPGYDPLAFAIEEAHKRGLELHAWFNPYRARHPSAKSPPTDDHVTKRWPDLARPYGTHAWMNPTHPTVRDHSLAVITEVVRWYDVDGVHIDDYFYPYKEKGADGKVIPFPDDDTWAEYQKTGGKLTCDDWRRSAVNEFVKQLYTQTKKIKPWVKVGISPFGIWRPGHPPGIAGLDQYAELYADAKLWLNAGWGDYFAPQLYWPINQEKQSFPKLLEWWSGENTNSRHLWPGLFTNRVTGGEKGWRATEVLDQIALTRKQKGAGGAIHFSAKTLMSNPDNLVDGLAKTYAERALVPESPWLAVGKPPAPPEAHLVMQRGLRGVYVKTAPGVRFTVVRTQTADGWHTIIKGTTEKRDQIILLPKTGCVVVSDLDRTGRESDPVELK